MNFAILYVNIIDINLFNNHEMKNLLFSLLFFLHMPVFAGSAEIKLINHSTREAKSYTANSRPFDIDLTFVKGWRKCTVGPVVDSTFSVVPGGKPLGRSSVRLFCATTAGHITTHNCTATEVSPLEFYRFTVAGVATTVDASTDAIKANSAVDIEISCKL